MNARIFRMRRGLFWPPVVSSPEPDLSDAADLPDGFGLVTDCTAVLT
jgi:hypothetical protein